MSNPMIKTNFAFRNN